MGEMRPSISKLRALVLFLGILTSAFQSAATAHSPGLLRTDTLFGIETLPSATDSKEYFFDFEAAGSPHSMRKDADGREDEEEGNDEIDILLSPSGTKKTTNLIVRVRRPGVLTVDSADGLLQAALEPTGGMRYSSWLAKVIHTGADGKMTAAVWPGDYYLHVEHGEHAPPASPLRFEFVDPCSGPEPGVASFLCARPLDPGHSVTSGIAGTSGDAGLFTLVLTAWQTIEIATAGAIDTAGELYDFDGRRLDTDDDGGHGVNFRIVRTLSPGRYFLRVEGRSGAEGTYDLSVEHVKR